MISKIVKTDIFYIKYDLDAENNFIYAAIVSVNVKTFNSM